MTYLAEKGKTGREPVTIVEMTLDECYHNHSQGGCSAPYNPGGECYNTFATCQVKEDYYPINTIAIKLSGAKDSVVPGHIPCIDKVSIAPTKITPGKGLGHRTQVTITCIDFAIADESNIDRYAENRNYIAKDTGTFWGKLLARNPHFVGRSLMVRQSHANDYDTTTGSKTRHYIIDRIDGPDKNGNVKIIAKDPLSLAESLKAQCPKPTNGALTADMSHGHNSHFSVGTGEGAQYPTGQFYVRIGSEIIRIASRSGDTLQIGDRGDKGSTADDHKQGDNVQQCYVASGTSVWRVDFVLYMLLGTYTEIDFSIIYSSWLDWQTEAAQWTPLYYLNTVISKPTSVQKLLDEICIETNTNIWWDDETQKIKWKAQVPVVTGLPVINDRKLIDKSVSITSGDRKRISQVHYYCNVSDWSESLDEKNYKNLVIRTDLESETEDAYKTPAIKKIFARWMQTDTIAGEVGSRIISRFKTPVVTLKGELDVKDDSIKAGDHFELESELIAGFSGAARPTEMQMLSTKPIIGKERIQFEALQFLFVGPRYGHVCPPSQADYTSSATGDQDSYGWIADNTTFKMSNGDDPYLII